MFDIKEARIAVVGLGYVGLPLAVEFGKHYPTIGLDTKESRIRELAAGEDTTREVDTAEIAKAGHLLFTHRAEELLGCNVYIITVPTPIDRYKRPDLSCLETGQYHGGRGAQPRRHRHLRIHGISRRNRRGLRARH